MSAESESLAANGGASNAEYSERINARMAKVTRRNEQRQRQLEQELHALQRSLQAKFHEEQSLAERHFHERVAAMQSRHASEQQQIQEYCAREMDAKNWQDAQQWQELERHVKDYVERRTHALQAEGMALQQSWQVECESLQRRAAEQIAELEAETKRRVEELTRQVEQSVGDAYKSLFEPIAEFAEATIGAKERDEFRARGFTVLRDVVPGDVVDRALQRVNATLARGFTGDEMVKRYRRPRDESSAEIQALLTRSPLLAIVRSLVRDAAPTYGGQIAVRFPGFAAVDNPRSVDPLADGTESMFEAPEWWSRAWHIDGGDTLPTHLGQFSLLVGVLLADVEQEFSGNLTVFEGAHRHVAEHIASVGARSIVAEPPQRFESALRDAVTPRLAPPTQVTGRRGDVVLAHYLMPHTVAPNLGSVARYAIYFRVKASQLGDYDNDGKPYHEPSLLNVENDFIYDRR
jgi:hypothetical protein